MIRVIASDLDGTLLDPDGNVSPRTARVLARARRAGIEVVAATGRPPRWVHHLAPGLAGRVEGGGASPSPGWPGHDLGDELELPSDIGRPLVDEAELTEEASAQVAICSNGALVIDLTTRAILTEHLIPAATAAEVMRRLHGVLAGSAFAVEWGHGFGCDERWLERLLRFTDDRPQAITIASGPELVTEPVVKVLAWHPERGGDHFIEAAAAAIGDLATVTSSGPQQLVEVSALGVDKGSALAEWCTDRGIGATEAVAFGDARNDVSMLIWAGTGVAMANAHPDVLAAADEITATNADDGVATWLERHL